MDEVRLGRDDRPRARAIPKGNSAKADSKIKVSEKKLRYV